MKFLAIVLAVLAVITAGVGAGTAQNAAPDVLGLRLGNKAITEAAKKPPARPYPHYDSADPAESRLDWQMEEFCASLDAKYDWAKRECIEPQPET